MEEHDKIKSLWKKDTKDQDAYDKDKLRNMLKKESNHILKKLIIKNIVNQILTIIVLGGIISGLFYYLSDTPVLLTNIGSVVLGCFFGYLSIIELKLIRGIQPGKQRVFEVQERFLKLKKFIYREKIYGYILGPILVLLLLPLSSLVIVKESIFDSWQIYLTGAIFGIIFFYPALMIMYRIYYRKSMKKLNESIQELMSYDQ